MTEEIKTPAAASPAMLDEDLVRRIADLLRETGLNELEIEANQMRIRASLGGSGQVVFGAPASVGAPVSGSSAPAAQEAAAPEAHPGTVKSPMVGTTYIAPEPSAPPFVKAGDQVAMGQTLLIIEAMKVMNPIPAPKAGTVKSVLVKDGQPVEFGDPLLIIE